MVYKPGTEADDEIAGTEDDDTLTGGLSPSGDDHLSGLGGDDHLYGDDGNDVLLGGAGNDLLSGDLGPGPDLPGSDVLLGGDGDDVIQSHGGNDRIDGGAGHDTASLEFGRLHSDLIFAPAVLEPFTIAGDGTTVTDCEAFIIYSGSGADRLSGLDGEDLFSGADGDDVLMGLGGDDRLFGGKGADVIAGGDGDDLLSGGDGAADRLDGGDGDDTVDLGFANDGDSASGGSGHDTLNLTLLPAETVGITYDGASHGLTISGSDVSISGFEAFSVYGGSSNDSISLRGTAESQTIHGGGGRDGLRGGSGDDTIIGGLGRDRIWGGAGNDSIYAGRSAFSSAPDGPDNVRGGLGDDTIYIGAGVAREKIDGGNGHDSVKAFGYQNTVMDVTSVVVAGETLTSVRGSILRNIENLTVYGSTLGDRMSGGASDDTFFGRAGDDVLSGGLGDDRLEGNEGDDTLDLESHGADEADVAAYYGASRNDLGHDRLTGFATEADKILLSGFAASEVTITDGPDGTYNVVIAGEFSTAEITVSLSASSMPGSFGLDCFLFS